jgi:hypothetical protein
MAEACVGQGILKIINNSVSSAKIYLNELFIVGPDRLNRNVETLEFEVDMIEGNNILKIELRGKPGGVFAGFQGPAARVFGRRVIDLKGRENPAPGLTD